MTIKQQHQRRGSMAGLEAECAANRVALDTARAEIETWKLAADEQRLAKEQARAEAEKLRADLAATQAVLFRAISHTDGRGER